MYQLIFLVHHKCIINLTEETWKSNLLTKKFSSRIRSVFILAETLMDYIHKTDFFFSMMHA